MNIGIPKECKILEGRVALIPQSCGELVQQGHRVCIQSGAGVCSGYSDQAYTLLGVECLRDVETLYRESRLIVKVKEPTALECEYLRPDHVLFCYLHLAALPTLQACLKAKQLTAIGFETVVDNGGLPLLAPMSHVAGCLAVQIGTHLLHAPQGGKGLLLGGLSGADRGRVVVLGAGVAGGNAARLAAQAGAQVSVFDQRIERLDAMYALGANVTALYPYADALHDAVTQADLLIGAVLVAGAKAPRLVSRTWVEQMSPGSVIVDIAVDQGGCIETTRATTYQDPTYVEYGVTHFGVTNMPGAVPKTSSQALCAAIMPYVARLAQEGWESDARLLGAVNVRDGQLVHPALREV